MLVVVALALVIVLTAGDYDLSVASVVGLSANLIAILNVNQGIGIGWAILIALGAGLVVGLVNGLFVVLVQVDSLIVTLGMATFVSGIVLWITGSNTLSGISNNLVNPVIVWRFAGVPFEFYYALFIALVVWYVFRFTPLGRRLLVVGRSRESPGSAGSGSAGALGGARGVRPVSPRLRRGALRGDLRAPRSPTSGLELPARLRGGVPRRDDTSTRPVPKPWGR